MNNLKKIGLTALGTALVTAGSAQAAALSVSASTSIFFNGEDNSNLGNGWSMTDSISFTASGEMDNGFTVSTTLELDGSALDDRSISIDTGDMGKLTFSGSGTSGPIGAWDDVTPSANEEAHGVAVAGTAAGAANAASSANRFVFDYTAMDGLAIKASYTPSAGVGRVESSTEIGALYTGIEGLSVYLAMGENNDQPLTGITGKSDLSAMAIKYAMGALTVGYQVNETDSGTASQDEDFTALGVSYAVSDDLSVSINQSEIDFESSAEDQEATGVSFSYTSGGMTISGTHSQVDNVAGTATADNTGYEINFIFAF
jgi:outer membrane protein OmpU